MSEIAVSPANGALMSFIERAAKDPDFDVQKFGELLRLQRDVSHDQARRAFNAAMAEAQSEMLPVVRDAKNSHLGNRYARLETIDAAMRPIYTRHGFSVRYGSAPAGEGFVRLTCTVAHAGGYFEENYLDAPIGNAGAQGGRTATTPVQSVGSTVTYLRRYLLGMVFNIVLADDDDDGEASRRAAATAMPRGARVAEKAPAERTTEQWQTWLDKLSRAALAVYHRSDLEDMARKDTVADAVATAPEWVQTEIAGILAANYARFQDDAEPEAELPEIAGQERVGAGD